MFTKIIKNDLKNSKLISITIFTFILFASFLLSTVGMISVNLYSSINLFLQDAKAPHFLQMHMGDFDNERMLNFAKSNKYVLDYQVLPFLNIDNSDILVNGINFAESSQDNGFSYQSEKFDYLLDLDRNIVYPNEGEIYIPLVYYIEGVLKEGDLITISNQNFIVKGFIRDAQMSSMLTSSKRFIIHPNDYEKIKSIGKEELLIEFLLNDLSKVNMFQADYATANLESNGPTITYSIIKLINALTDYILIAILSLIALLIMIVSFLSIRLTLIAKIEDEYKTIGVLKAIGLRLSIIKKIYWGKYAFLAFFASIFGFIFTILFSSFFLKNIKMFFGENESKSFSLLIAFLGSMLIFLIVMIYINYFLNKLKKLSPAETINTGIVYNSSYNLNNFKLRNQNLLSTDLFLGINQIMSRKKSYFTYIIILIIASFVMVLPANIYSSISSDSFITYMGVGNGEAMIVLSGKYNIKDLNNRLKSDLDLEDFAIYDSKNYEFMLDDNTVSKMWVTLGNQNKYSVLYTQGEAPNKENEIAISYLNALSLEKKVGDYLYLVVNGIKEEFTISGIYSDITNGGKTARATFYDDLTPSLNVSVIMNFKKDVKVNEKLKSFEKDYPNAKVYHIKTYRDSVFGTTLNNIKSSVIISMILSIGLIFLITLLFLNMIIVKDRHNIAIFKSLGFNYKNIRKQYMVGSLLLVIISMIIGMMFVSSFGEFIVSSFIETMGVANFKFDINEIFIFFIVPIIMILTVYIGTNISSSLIKKIKISDYIRG